MGQSEAATTIQNYYGKDYSSFYSMFFQGHVKKAGSGWLVICPFHGDDKASLSVDMTTGMYHCHACGAEGNAIQFYMRHNSLDFVSACREICQNIGVEFPEAKPKQKPLVVATYDYTDSTGKMIFQTLRYEPKDFKQRKPAGNGWEWTLKGVELVPYNLPAVIKANQILILEGEKDVETAKSFGLTGTTSPMGAGKWRDCFNRYFIGKEIVLCPDNDAPGKKHMLDVGTKLQGIAGSIRWAEYPDRFSKLPKFDFTDFIKSFESQLDAAYSVDELVRGARLFNPSKIIIPEPDSEKSEMIKKWILAAPGEFSVRDLDYDLDVKGPEAKQDRTKILEKFVAEKIISREGKRRGLYRPYYAELEKMEFRNANDDFLPIWMPFGLHELVGILPGNIIIVAGEPNAGKTGLLLNIIKANRKKFNCHYFNSEMGGGELKSRLSKFTDVGIDDWNFSAYHRDDNFADVVFQGQQSLNIIDFLEVHDDFFLVGEKIKQIHSALHGAVAIIALQRNKGNEFGLGGQRTMEKARLVINVSPGEVKITKAKNFVNPEINPNGLKINFKLAQGCKFTVENSWYKEQR